jgi:hypothetical protein
MTNTIKTPTDGELLTLIRSFGYTTARQTEEIADAILARWGTAPTGEPVAWQGVHDPTDLYHRKPPQADVHPLYRAASPQPAEPPRVPQPMPDLTQLTERGATAWAGVDPQALREGRVPLTKEQVQHLIEAKHFRNGYPLTQSDKVCLNWYRLGLRDGEAAHGIKHKEGGQDGAP